MRLYSWHSSSTSFRVRIAMGLKGLAYEPVPINLSWADSDHDKPEYRAFNPQTNIPVLEDGDVRIVQSLAILEYLEETRPEPPLLPRVPAERARVRSLALYVACEIQAPNNLRVQRQLSAQLGADKQALSRWQLHWCQVGFDALEGQLTQGSASGRFCHGDSPTLADCCLVPQVYSSLRPVVGADLSRWPTIKRIYENCLALPAVQKALPPNQPGYESPTGH